MAGLAVLLCTANIDVGSGSLAIGARFFRRDTHPNNHGLRGRRKWVR